MAQPTSSRSSRTTAKPFLCQPENVKLLRQALRSTMERHPLEVDAFVLLPDHLHTIWTLPDDDRDFSTRWRLIKSYFSRNCQTTFERAAATSRQNQKRARILATQILGNTRSKTLKTISTTLNTSITTRSSTAWLAAPKDWEHSSFHRYVQAGVYDANCGIKGAIN